MHHAHDPYIELGVIQRKQGLQGHIVLHLHEHGGEYLHLKALYVQIDHTFVPYNVEKFLHQHHSAVVKLQGIDNPQVAHNLVGLAAFVPQAMLQKVYPSKLLSVKKLIGYYTTDIKLGFLGPVRTMYTSTQQYILGIDFQNKELLVPYHEAIVKRVNHMQQTITVQLPSGFIEAVL